MKVQDLMELLKKFPPDADITIATEELHSDYDKDGHDIDVIDLVGVDTESDEVILLANDIEVARLDT